MGKKGKKWCARAVSTVMLGCHHESVATLQPAVSAQLLTSLELSRMVSCNIWTSFAASHMLRTGCARAERFESSSALALSGVSPCITKAFRTWSSTFFSVQLQTRLVQVRRSGGAQTWRLQDVARVPAAGQWIQRGRVQRICNYGGGTIVCWCAIRGPRRSGPPQAGIQVAPIAIAPIARACTPKEGPLRCL